MNSNERFLSLLQSCEKTISQLYNECQKRKPEYPVTREDFKKRIESTIQKYLLKDTENLPSSRELKDFIKQLYVEDIYLSIACEKGDEKAWLEFDQTYRSYLQKVAIACTNSFSDAEEIVLNIYCELYGTSLKEGKRNSKFSTYSGRGSLRGWLKTIILNSSVDLHRASESIVSLDEIVDEMGEGTAHSFINKTEQDNEKQIITHLERKKYFKACSDALEEAFKKLNDHEKLLLLYYHVEKLKLKDIAKIVELPSSPLKNLFRQRIKSNTRVHESTIKRWLDKTYLKLHKHFRKELSDSKKLKPEEIEVCLKIVTEELPKLSFSLSEKT